MPDTNSLIIHMKLIWEIPLALFSFIFYKVMRIFIGGVYAAYLAKNQETAKQWRVLSAETLKNPIALPVIMTRGPRWNTHALVASAGPFAVQESLAVDVESAQKSAQSWTIVVYSYPSYQTIFNFGSLSSACTEPWESVKLNPGQYTLVLRYYDWGDRVQLPALKVDDRAKIESNTISKDSNDFLFTLKENKNWLYLALHYYIFTILRLRHWLPESFVRNELLPVGDRDNQFGYGYLSQGESLQAHFETSVLDNYDVYLTLYNRSSFPTLWYQLTQATETTKPSETDGFYLLRFRKKSQHQNRLSIEYDDLKSFEQESVNQPQNHIIRVQMLLAPASIYDR